MAVHPIDIYLIIIDTSPQDASESTLRRVAMGSLLPLCEWLESEASIKVGLRLSRATLMYLFMSAPKLSKRIETLYESGQILPIGGSSVDAPLHILSGADVAEHIATDRSLWRQAMAVIPEGAWNIAGCYDPHLPEVLVPTGVQFCWAPLHYLGGADWGWTERAGHRLAVFGIDEALSQLFIWGSPKAFWIQLQQRAAQGIKYVSIVTELHNFGARSDAKIRIEEQKWLTSFSKALEALRMRIKMVHPTEKLSGKAPTVYPISGPMDRLALLWGVQPYSPWERVLSEHPQANFLQKSMGQATVLRRHLEIKIKPNHPQFRYVKKMIDLIVPAQSGQALTPFPMGHLQSSSVRAHQWKRLEQAQRLGEELQGYADKLTFKRSDTDCDGDEECTIVNSQARFVIYPKWGGAIGQWRMPNIGNLINTLRRRSYPWHSWIEGHTHYPVIVGETFETNRVNALDKAPTTKENVQSNIVPDKHLRGCLVDHIYDTHWTLDNIRRGQAPTIGDFHISPYRVIQFDKPEPSLLSLKLERVGYVQTRQGERLLTIEKVLNISQHSNSIHVFYRLRNRSDAPITAVLGIELNWNVDGIFSNDRYLQFENDYRRIGLRRSGIEDDVRCMVWTLGSASTQLKSSIPVRVLYYPNEVPMMTLDGYDMSFQGTCINIMTDVNLWGGETMSFELELSAMENR